MSAQGPNGGVVYSGATGRYRLTLPPSARGYIVCFNGHDARYDDTTAAPARGFGNVCLKQQPWSTTRSPVHATPVPVSAGTVRRGVNATLGFAGAITGYVTFDGTPLPGVDVLLTDPQGRYVADTYPDSTGTHTFTGVSPAATGYKVCFDGLNDWADQSASPVYGFLSSATRTSSGPTSSTSEAWRTASAVPV